jgi:hypothetical protein
MSLSSDHMNHTLRADLDADSGRRRVNQNAVRDGLKLFGAAGPIANNQSQKDDNPKSITSRPETESEHERRSCLTVAADQAGVAQKPASR